MADTGENRQIVSRTNAKEAETLRGIEENDFRRAISNKITRRRFRRYSKGFSPSEETQQSAELRP